MQRSIALGLMSGTSMDGVDVAVIDTDGIAVHGFGPMAFRPYTDDERALLRQALSDARTLNTRTARPGVLGEAEAMVTRAHIVAIEAVLERHPDLKPDLIGFHGQTVLHSPDRGLTVQIGDGALMARHFNVPVVYDFRANDVAAGGEGAPLAPVYHRALVKGAGLALPAAVLNLGGVANLTLIGEDDDALHAFDTGPANALMDDLILKTLGLAYDEGGARAARGKPDEDWLAQALSNPYFTRALPKSLDRDAFQKLPLPESTSEDAESKLQDRLATYLEFTARTVAAGVRMLPQGPRILVAAGGGARNPVLLEAIARHTELVVTTADDLGWRGDAIEAEAFAFMAVRMKAGRPISFPGTTGVSAPTCGGIIALPLERT